MTRSLNLTRVDHEHKTYDDGILEVDEERKTVQVSVLKGRIRKTPSVVLTLGYAAPIEIVADGEKLKLGGAILYFRSQEEAVAIKALLTVPDTSKFLASASDLARKLLRDRASAVASMVSLKANPREYLIQSFPSLPDGVEDPAQRLVVLAEESARKALETFSKGLAECARGLQPAQVRGIQASVYAIASAQDSLLSGDAMLMKDALALLSQVAPGDYPSLEALLKSTPQKATEMLLEKWPVGPAPSLIPASEQTPASPSHELMSSDHPLSSPDKKASVAKVEQSSSEYDGAKELLHS